MTGTALQSLHAQKIFLEALAQTGVITHAAEVAGVHRTTAYDWKNADPEFAAAMAAAELESVERMEYEARRRAVEGDEIAVYGKNGQVLGSFRKRSDVLLMFMLKKAKPEYRDSQPPVNIDMRSQTVVNIDSVILEIVAARQAALSPPA